jgi:hypothetical protein
MCLRSTAASKTVVIPSMSFETSADNVVVLTDTPVLQWRLHSMVCLQSRCS